MCVWTIFRIFFHVYFYDNEWQETVEFNDKGHPNVNVNSPDKFSFQKWLYFCLLLFYIFITLFVIFNRHHFIVLYCTCTTNLQLIHPYSFSQVLYTQRETETAHVRMKYLLGKSAVTTHFLSIYFLREITFKNLFFFSVCLLILFPLHVP